eukprot:CAMPEP_0202723850 /NCGR_PEP_ID=MMETSP1385-20130828/169016_1 /ASSEMBLY_ACC=CAM_ASM_000861 /TAXON_ID=933848 /ORGANISM="Elphidium margaritaceum" /LENGTH=103 /DNA_ID=CAMNT_0049389221 /DNA_START=43 /DNA_END=350 /DNA_ORIENTATION=+
MAAPAEAPVTDFQSLTNLDDLSKYIATVAEDQNVVLCFIDPKEDVANPMTDRLQNIMDNEQIYTVTVAVVDKNKANKDILDKYKVNCDTIIAIDKTKNGYPAV